MLIKAWHFLNLRQQEVAQRSMFNADGGATRLMTFITNIPT
jgi:hypothetical protein